MHGEPGREHDHSQQYDKDADHDERHLVVAQSLPDALPIALALLCALEGHGGIGGQGGGSIGHCDPLPPHARVDQRLQHVD